MLKRLPNLPDIVSVYAVIASMLFAWSMLLFFWYLPSWLYFMALGDLIAVFCYIMASSFFESLFFLLFLLVLSFSLPSKYLRDEFTVRGTSITLCVIGLIMIQLSVHNVGVLTLIFSRNAIGLVLVTVVVSLLSTKINLVRQTLILFSDRLTVFLYILIPVSLFSLLVIILRNIV